MNTKIINGAILALCLTTSHSADVYVHGGYGGNQNLLPMGVVLNPTTLNAGIDIRNYLGASLQPDGAITYKWNKTTQSWNTSIYDSLLGGWDPNFSIAAGDALYILYNPSAPDSTCYYPSNQSYKWHAIAQKGTDSGGYFPTVTIKPGNNLLARGNLHLNFAKKGGDKIILLPNGQGNYEENPCNSGLEWTWTYLGSQRFTNSVTQQIYWQHTWLDYNNQQTTSAYPVSYYSDAFWYYSTSSTNWVFPTDLVLPP